VVRVGGGLGALMTSTIRYSSFKDIPWTRNNRHFPLWRVLMLAWCGDTLKFALVILAGTYAAVGGALHLCGFIRHRMVSRTA